MSQDASHRPTRVLLVEDDEDDYVLVRHALRTLGAGQFALDWRDDANEALEVLIEGRHDLVLLDYHLGAVTGLELLEEARKRGCFTPVILLTGVGDVDIDRRALEAGASDFLVKSHLSSEVLERAIRYTLQHARVLEALRRSHAGFSELIERLPDAITVWQERRLVYANPALVALLGATSADEFVGKSGNDLESIVHPEDRALMRKVLYEGLQGERSMRELRFLRRSGEVVPAEVAHFAVSFDGRPSGMWVARDISERRQMQTRLLLADRMASLGTLAGGIGHELNNPLAYVIANLTHLESEILPSLQMDSAQREELTELLAETQQGVQRIREISQQLRIFSHVEREARSTQVDVHRVLESAVRLAWNELRHRAQLVRDYTDELLVEAQEPRLAQVFLNLLANAARSIPESGVDRHEIRIVTRRRQGLAVIEIRDTGEGIPAELQERIFEPFLTLRPGGATTGLSLSVCLGIVTGFNGRMEVESKVGQGSVFRIILPAVTPEASAAPPVAAPSASAERRGRLLSVDDEPMIGMAIVRALKQEHDVTTLTSAREALTQLIGGQRYDLILCDLMMPEMSGMDLFEEIIRVAPEQAERVMFLTGGAFTPGARDFLNRVKSRYMEKPFTPRELREFVKGMIGRAQVS